MRGLTLADAQGEFMRQILEDGRALPGGWSARQAEGLAIYRNAYRARLVDALEESFERVLRWVGEEAFRAAAAHHLILSPPASWTLDDAGAGFDTVLTELFPADPEVGELAWLEWHMGRAAVAADAHPMDRAGFARASAGFAAEDWARLRFAFVPALVHRQVATDCAGLWKALRDDTPPPDPLALESPSWLVVWKEGLDPVFTRASPAEGRCLALAEQGGTYGDVCAMLESEMGMEAAVAEASALLGRWLDNGLITGIST